MDQVKFTKEEILEMVERTLDMYENPDKWMKNANIDEDGFYPYMCGWMYGELSNVRWYLKDYVRD